MSEIDGRKLALHKLFDNEFFFKIPEYQRPYSWQAEHCEQLFNDILESDRNNEYFLGTVILQEIGSIGTGKRYDIIDGQQRITTLQILLSCLRDRINDDRYKSSLTKLIFQPDDPVSGVPERVRIEVKDKEKAFFRKFVQEVDSTIKIDCHKIDNDQQENIINAIKVFNKRIEELSTSEIENFIKHLSQKCVVIFVSTKMFDDAYRLFTIINDRGLQLRRIDILKAQNIDPSLIKDDTTRIEYARKWEDMEDELGGDEFERLFFIIRTIEVKEKAKEDLLNEFENNIFKKGKINKGKDFIDYVKDYQSLYKDLVLDKTVLNNKDFGIKFNNLLNIMLDYLKGSDWIPPLLCYYKKFGSNKIFEFLTMLEKIYCYSWVTGTTKDKRLVDMCAIVREIDKLTADGVIDSNVLQFDWQKFESAIIDPDFYKKSYAKYILVKLEYLSSDNTTARNLGVTSIEHVLPQVPKENSDWLVHFSEAEREKWTHNIANLILLSKRKNSSASNLDFTEKKDKYFKGKITDLARSLQILTEPEWTPATLEKRQQEIVEMLK